MGTDISIFAEVRRHGIWIPAEPEEKNSDYWFDEIQPQLKPKAVWVDRNYALFAVLANVCNPIRSVVPFECIAEPRGLPADLSEPIRAWHAHWGSDAFSEGWLLVQELTAFDWHGKTIRRRSVVDRKAAYLFRGDRQGFPFVEWPKDLPIQVANQGVGVEVKWTETYAQAVGEDFLTRILSLLRSYGSERDVRVVFWFDH